MLNEREQRFVDLLNKYKVAYEPKKVIHLSTDSIGQYIIPDFYLPDYKGYCEVIWEHPPDEIKRLNIRKLMIEGERFTFYHTDGEKYTFQKKSLQQFGVVSNDAFFDIRELYPDRFITPKLKHTIKSWYSAGGSVETIADCFYLKLITVLNIVNGGEQNVGI